MRLASNDQTQFVYPLWIFKSAKTFKYILDTWTTIVAIFAVIKDSIVSKMFLAMQIYIGTFNLLNF